MNCCRFLSMTFQLEEQFDSGEEGKLVCDLRLVKREDGCTIVVVDLYFPDTSRCNVPRLFLRHRVSNDVARPIRYAKHQNVLEIVLNCVPTWSPCWQAQCNLRLIDVFDYSGYMKFLS